MCIYLSLSSCRTLLFCVPDMQTDVVKWSAVSMETVGKPHNITTVCQPYCHTRQLRFNTILAQLAIGETHVATWLLDIPYLGRLLIFLRERSQLRIRI